jgi:hypothetical protein
MVAPGTTAFFWSVTRPEILPVEDWEKRVPKLASTTKREANDKPGGVFMVIFLRNRRVGVQNQQNGMIKYSRGIS